MPYKDPEKRKAAVKKYRDNKKKGNPVIPKREPVIPKDILMEEIGKLRKEVTEKDTIREQTIQDLRKELEEVRGRIDDHDGKLEDIIGKIEGILKQIEDLKKDNPTPPVDGSIMEKIEAIEEDLRAMRDFLKEQGYEVGTQKRISYPKITRGVSVGAKPETGSFMKDLKTKGKRG